MSDAAAAPAARECAADEVGCGFQVLVGVDPRAVGVAVWRACIWESSDLDGARPCEEVEDGGAAEV